MSVRYTGEALAMSPVIDDVALRDVEPWKDRLEVRLDNRQVFFLFFGSAMVACLLFVLGVIVGKKLETRGHAEAPAIEDPLAILDRLGSQGPMPAEQAVTFPKALTTSAPVAARSHVPSSLGLGLGLGAREAVREPARADVAPPVAAHAKPSTPVPSAALGRTLTSAVPKPAPVLAPPAPSVAKTASASATAPTPATSSPSVSTAPARAPTVNSAPRPAAPAAPAPVPAASKGRFTLQLSAYQDKAEAEAMVRRLGAGHASLVPTEIPGKGTWYRVRAGSFGTFQEAAAAKAAFEREHNVIAYVASGAPPKP